MAISTYGISLMYKAASGSTYTKLIDIKDFPDLGGAPEMLETTTLSDSMQTYIPGIRTLDALEFTANYTLADYQTIKGMGDTEHDFAVWFGTDGAEGKFEFKGRISAFPVGGGVNEVVGMTITIAPSTAITLATSSN